MTIIQNNTIENNDKKTAFTVPKGGFFIAVFLRFVVEL